MKDLVRRLASLKLAVVLLVLLLVALSAGTIIESQRGAEAAGRLVYRSFWLIGLEALFAVNVLAAVVNLFPWGRPRIGFVTTHGALIVILLGALTSWAFKQEGQLPLWEGEQASSITDVDGAGNVLSRTSLPFSIKLTKFTLDRYPGIGMPSGFRSDVEVIEGGRSRPAAIWMNHELTVSGWKLFQSSYRIEGDRRETILSVSSDPGQPIVFFGYLALLVGMCIVMATRASQRTRTTASKATGKATAGKVAADRKSVV
jgi:cytochrome c biogenesis protein ResB